MSLCGSLKGTLDAMLGQKDDAMRSQALVPDSLQSSLDVMLFLGTR